jgi:signal transduction histidine kinase
VDGARQTEQVIRELAGSLLAARDDERRRVGRDLHESIAQTLAAAAWTARDVQRRMPEAKSTLTHLEALLKQSIHQVEEVSNLLHPPLLDEAGLESALSQFADQYSERNSTKVDVEVSPDLGRLPTHMELALFRLVEQALETVRRRAPGQASRITLARVASSGSRDLLLTVEGIAKNKSDPAGAPSVLDKIASIGQAQSVEIASMRERVGQMGGELQFDSTAGRAVVRAIVPLDRSA